MAPSTNPHGVNDLILRPDTQQGPFELQGEASLGSTAMKRIFIRLPLLVERFTRAPSIDSRERRQSVAFGSSHQGGAVCVGARSNAAGEHRAAPSAGRSKLGCHLGGPTCSHRLKVRKPRAVTPQSASKGDPGHPATAGDQRSAHARRPRPDDGLGPRAAKSPSISASVDGATYV